MVHWGECDHHRRIVSSDAYLVPKKQRKSFLILTPLLSLSFDIFMVTMKCKAKSAYRLRDQRVYNVRRTDFSALEFERVEKAHFLRYTLATIVLSFGNLTKLSHSLFGLVPENSLLDKCPYYRVPSPEEAPNVPRSLKWVVSTREKIAQEKPSVSKKRVDHLGQIRLSKKGYKRDTLTIPGMVVLYNTLLAWMMFHIEMGATSL